MFLSARMGATACGEPGKGRRRLRTARGEGSPVGGAGERTRARAITRCTRVPAIWCAACGANPSRASERTMVEARGEPAPRGRPLGYLISRHEHNRLELFAVAAAPRGEALLIFGSDRTAQGFLLGCGLGGGWGVRETTTGELVSLLLGHLANVETVALDPGPGSLTAQDTGSGARSSS